MKWRFWTISRYYEGGLYLNLFHLTNYKDRVSLHTKNIITTHTHIKSHHKTLCVLWRKRAKRNYLQLCDIIFHNSISQKIIAKESPKNIVDTAENNCFFFFHVGPNNKKNKKKKKKKHHK